MNPKHEQQPVNLPRWDPEKEGRLEQEAWTRHRQRQRGRPEPTPPSLDPTPSQGDQLRQQPPLQEVQQPKALEMSEEDWQDQLHYSMVAAKAAAAGLQLGRSEMPDASDTRLLALMLTNIAACLGRLRMDFNDVQNLVQGAFEQGSRMPPLPGDPPRFELEEPHHEL